MTIGLALGTAKTGADPTRQLGADLGVATGHEVRLVLGAVIGGRIAEDDAFHAEIVEPIPR